MRKNSTKPIGETLAEFHRVDEETGCWLWTGTTNKLGYGYLSRKTEDRGRVNVMAHRASYEHHVGPIPHGLFVCHHCDVRNCIKPDHLFVGTQLQNVQDMIAKGRDRFGVGHRPTTFPEEKLIEIANDNRDPKTVAAEHGVTWQTVYRWRAKFRSRAA